MNQLLSKIQKGMFGKKNIEYEKSNWFRFQESIKPPPCFLLCQI